MAFHGGTILVLLLLDLIPGAVCYDYNVGGLVASVVAGVFCLIGVIAMILVAVMWHDWYERRMARRGIYRIPRDQDSYRGWFRKKEKRYSHTVESTPRSERNGGKRMYMPGSRDTTINQDVHTGAYITNLNGPDTFEEKGGTMMFEAEDDAVIVADVLPEQQNYRHTQQLSSTQQNYRHTQQLSSTQQNGGFTVTSVTPNQNEVNMLSSTQTATGDASRTTYVALTSKSADSPRQLRQTTDNVIRREPIHVHGGKISQTTRPNTGQSDVFITPLIPAADGNDTAQAAPVTNSGAEDVVIFDSEDEAGFVPYHQNEVLF